jgi:hypothetical protein
MEAGLQDGRGLRGIASCSVGAEELHGQCHPRARMNTELRDESETSPRPSQNELLCSWLPAPVRIAHQAGTTAGMRWSAWLTTTDHDRGGVVFGIARASPPFANCPWGYFAARVQCCVVASIKFTFSAVPCPLKRCISQPSRTLARDAVDASVLQHPCRERTNIIGADVKWCGLCCRSGQGRQRGKVVRTATRDPEPQNLILRRGTRVPVPDVTRYGSPRSRGRHRMKSKSGAIKRLNAAYAAAAITTWASSCSPLACERRPFMVAATRSRMPSSNAVTMVSCT